MISNGTFSAYLSYLQRAPDAHAAVRGSRTYARIRGIVNFYQTPMGVLVAADISGLPTAHGKCDAPILGFHIHEGTSCTGNEQDPFANSLTHYNPHGCPHPYHAGDMPPLFVSHGKAITIFLTSRFSVREIIGKTVLIHSAPDDFTTQPAGNAGNKIACGEITKA